MPSQSRRGRPRTITLDAVLEAGRRIADDGGLERVTMARVAERVGCGTMSLYTHVSDRDALLRGMADSVFMELGATGVLAGEPPADWREALSTWMDALRAGLRRHPWVLDVIAVHNRVTPGWLSLSARLIAAFRAAGLDPARTADATLLVASISVGVLIQESISPLPLTAQVSEAIAQAPAAVPAIPAADIADLLPRLGEQTNEWLFDSVKGFLIASIEPWFERA